MNVLSFLTPKSHVAFLFISDTLRQAIEKMEAHGYSSIPVLTDDGKYFANLSTGDLLHAIREHRMDWEQFSHVSLRDVPRSRVYEPVNANAKIEDLYSKILVQNYVPVVDDQNIFIGIVTRKMIFDYWLKSKKV